MCPVFPFFNVRHPPGFQGNSHIPKGNLVCICMKHALFWQNQPDFSSGRGCFLALSAAGIRGGHRTTTAQVWAPAGLRGACSGHSKPRDLASNRGIACRRDKSQPGPLNPPKCQFFSCFLTSLLLFVKYHNRGQRLGSHGTRAALHAFPFFTATNGT